MRRAHAMPFGAEVLADAAVRFRLWAPVAQAVALRLDGEAPLTLPMPPVGGGWFELTTEAARPGTRYLFLIDGAQVIPDPASRFQPDDVHAASEVIDPRAFDWSDMAWRGRPWEETVLYELHVGAFTAGGDYAGIIERLDDLADLGVTAIELMPLAEAPGRYNWGYDGAYPFAPERQYGRPEDLKALVQAAHGSRLMVFVDVVYNHFGPEGNYLHRYAPQFFTDRHQTPWGAAINFDGPDSRTVRDFFIHNALYWIEEFNIDGLRLDAVHAVLDDNRPDILTELAESVHRALPADRHVHLVLENDDNAARYLERDDAGRPRWYVAQWNDDIHHVLHALLTDESGGYYRDYRGDRAARLGRALTEGFIYQGEPSAHRGGRRRGAPSRHLPPTAFVSFLQNHDQIGNRAFGERIGGLASPEAIRAAVAILLLAPSPPLLFMGEEWGAAQPFLFFCDFGLELAEAVREGRRREFARFPELAATRARIPDPIAPESFAASVLDWHARLAAPHSDWLAFYEKLLTIRRREIVPRLAGTPGDAARLTLHGAGLLQATWRLGDGSTLELVALMSARSAEDAKLEVGGRLLFATPDGIAGGRPLGFLPAWSVAWFLTKAADGS